MPLHEYRCGGCGHAFEHLATTSSSKPGACPKCGSRKLEKQFSTFSASAGSFSESLPCSTGACGTGSCPTGTCPFSQN